VRAFSGRAPEAATTTALPSFFVLGAQKAGTTSLDAWLRLQPGLALPALKETHFFSDDERHAKGLAWYLGRFAARTPAALRGEVDPDYLGAARAPERMARLYPEPSSPPRLVAVLREPLARAHSQWSMTRRRGLEPRPFAEALRASWRDDEPGDGHHDYYARGRYARHLARYRAAFPGAPLLVLRFEELFAPESRAETFRRLCAFLGVAGAVRLPAFEAVHNGAGRARSALLNRFLQRRGPVRRALGRLIPGQDLRLRLGVLLERANTRPGEGPEPLGEPLRGPLPAEVRAAMLDDVLALERDLGWNLAAWRENLERCGEAR